MKRISHVCLLWFLAVLACVPGCRLLKPSASVPDPACDPSGQCSCCAQTVPKPSKYSFRIAPYVFLSDFELKPDLPLFKELAGLRDQVYKELQLPSSDTPILVYLFEDRENYDRYMKAKYPHLPRRRAYFMTQGRIGREDLVVFTSWGDRVRQDLRHELTHALLHSVLKNVPLWLDEGLAEYFELSPDCKGVNDTYLSHIRRSTSEPFKPDLARLEKLEQVHEMTPAEYREAWAWVHFLLRGSPVERSALLSYLQQLRTSSNPGPLRGRLAGESPEDSLTGHLENLDFPLRVGSAQR